MRACTPHFAFGIEPSILHGDHFYLIELMPQTLQSLMHSFVLSNFITNTTHYPSRAILRRLVIFCYMGLIEKKFRPGGEWNGHMW